MTYFDNLGFNYPIFNSNNVKMPDINIPDVKMPDVFSLPIGNSSNNIKIPHINIPDIFKIDFTSIFRNMKNLFSFPLFNIKQPSMDYGYNAYQVPKNYSNTKDIIDTAKAEVGHVGGSRYGNKGAWCATFVSWLYGGKNAPWGNQYSVKEIKRLAKENGAYQEGSKLTNVQPGDLVIWRPETCNGISHVEIVTGVVNGKVKTIGGNCYNKVVINEYPAGTTFDGFVKINKYKQNQKMNLRA